MNERLELAELSRNVEIKTKEEKMNIYKFINSRDIAEHLKKINYEFSCLECAWLIWQSQNTTLEERHEAWRMIIKTMPDCAIEPRLHKTPRESLHRFLENYITIENKLISCFFAQGPNAAYTYRFYCEGEGGWCEENGPLYPTFDACFAAFEENMDQGIEPLDSFVELTKTWVDGNKRKLYLRMTLDKQIVRVDETCFLTDEREVEDFDIVFMNMWFTFPTPFQKGDIIEEVRGKYEVHYRERNIFALKLLCTEIEPKRLDRLKRSGDSSDMTAYGYFVDPAGHIYNECIHHYMDCEYVREELQDEKRLLISISNFLKGKIALDLFLAAQLTLCCENEMREKKRMLSWYTSEGLKLAGLET